MLYSGREFYVSPVIIRIENRSDCESELNDDVASNLDESEMDSGNVDESESEMNTGSHDFQLNPEDANKSHDFSANEDFQFQTQRSRNASLNDHKYSLPCEA